MVTHHGRWKRPLPPDEHTSGTLAKAIGVHQRTIGIWTAAGWLPVARFTLGGAARYSGMAVAAALQRRGMAVPPALTTTRVPIPVVVRSVYVAGPSAELERCRNAMAVLRDAGIRITHDWTPCVTADAPPSGRALVAECAEDLAGVAVADALLVLAPRSGVSGCWVEMGAALALRRPIVVSRGSCPIEMCFFALAHMVSDDARACAILTHRAPPRT